MESKPTYIDLFKIKFFEFLYSTVVYLQEIDMVYLYQTPQLIRNYSTSVTHCQTLSKFNELRKDCRPLEMSSLATTMSPLSIQI